MNVLYIFIGLFTIVLCEEVGKRYVEDAYNLKDDQSYIVDRYGDNPEGKIVYVDDKRYDKMQSRDFDDEYKYRSSEVSDEDEYSDLDDDKVNVVGLRREDREDLVRPCSLDDWRCIRRFFAKNSKCKSSSGPISDPLYLRRSTYYIPSVNLTLITTRLRVSGQSGIKVSEFYYNKDTGNLVLGLQFQKINLTTPRGYFRYQRTAKESIVLDDYATVAVGGTITVIIPKIPNLRLDLAEIHVFINDRLPPFFIGPGAVSTDPDVASAFAQLIANLPNTLQEAGLFIAQLVGARYIQENICDFGLKITSV